MFLHTILGKGTDVKGFEIEAQEKKRIEAGEAYLMDYLS